MRQIDRFREFASLGMVSATCVVCVTVWAVRLYQHRPEDFPVPVGPIEPAPGDPWTDTYTDAVGQRILSIVPWTDPGNRAQGMAFNEACVAKAEVADALAAGVLTPTQRRRLAADIAASRDRWPPEWNQPDPDAPTKQSKIDRILAALAANNYGEFKPVQ